MDRALLRPLYINHLRGRHRPRAPHLHGISIGRKRAMGLGGGAMSDRPDTPLLDQVATPEDLRRLQRGQLRRLADELRAETISAVSVTGGHLGAGLGVVELSVAL